MNKTKHFLIALIALILSLFSLSACTSSSMSPADLGPDNISDVYIELRSMIINIDPQEIGIIQGQKFPNVWGVLMEFELSNSPVTLVALADRTTSLYTGHGGGIIGSGEHEDVAFVTMDYLHLAENYLDDMERVSTLELPDEEGIICFHLLTFDGKYSIKIDEDDLIKGDHSLSPLFFKANDVISEIRKLELEN